MTLNANFTRGKTAAEASGAKPVVLIVDDEPAIGQALGSLIRRRFEVLLATSGAEALALVPAHPEIAVVISDQRMPLMEGDELLARIRAVAPDIVRILITGYSDMESLVRAVNEAKIFAFLTKPWESAQLYRTLDSAAEQHQRVKASGELVDQLRATNADLQRQLDEYTRLAAAPGAV